MSEKKQLYYGWVVFGCCFFIFFFVLGMTNSPSSLFIVPVSEFYGFSRSAFSLTISLSTIAAMIVGILYGGIYQRIGVRNIIIIGCLSEIISFLILWQATNLPVFYIGGALMGIGLGFCSTTSITILINSWFSERQGLLLGIVAAGSGLGGSLFSIIVGKMIATTGPKSAYLLIALALAVVSIPIILLVKEKPAEEANTAPHGHGGNGGMLKEFGALLKTSAVRNIFIAVILTGIAIHPILIIVPAHLTDNGFDSVFAATISGSIFFVLAAAKIALGWIHDRFGVNIATIIGYGAFVLGSILLIFVRANWQAWIFVVLFGFAVAPLSVLIPLTSLRVLGRENYKKFLGLFISCLSAGISIGVPLLNSVYDLIGSYAPVIAVFAGIGFIAMILILSTVKKIKTQEVV